MKKTTTEVQTNNDDDDFILWRDEDNKNDDHNSAQSLSCLCQWVVKGMPNARSGACRLTDRKPCYYCRRVAYAKVCVASGVFSSVFSRWQEWCTPFLFASRIASAAHAMVLVESEIKTMLGMLHSPVRCLCRTGAAMRIDGRQCTCHTVELRDSLVGLAEHGTYNQGNARHMQAPTSSQEQPRNSNLKQDAHIIDAHCSTALTLDQVKANCKNLSKDLSGKNKVLSFLWQVAVPCRRVGRRRMGQPRSNQLTKIIPEWKKRQGKSNASLGYRLLRRKMHASVPTTDGDTHALPYAVRSADKIQTMPTTHNARFGRRVLRLPTKLSVPSTSSNKNRDASIDVPATQCSCSERLTADNCKDTVACQPSLCKEYRFVGGGLAPANTPAASCTSDLHFDPKEVVTAICLSHFHDSNFVEELLAQDWVNTWSGWTEVADDASNAVWEAFAERFIRLAMEHVPSSQKTNAQRLGELHEQGLQLKRASAHGVNNCLIDALLLGLLDAGLVPETMSLSLKQRRHLCAACRLFLYNEHGTPPRIYLDAHRDGPRVLDFFLRKKWPQDVAVRVWLYNRFDHLDNGLGADDALRWIDFECATGAAVTRYALHVYNQTDANQRGYHFDALLARHQSMHQNVSSASSGGSSDKTAPTKIRHAAPEASEDERRLPKRARLLHLNTIVALRALRQNGWQLHPCSWPTAQNSLLEAMLLALSFHEWISHAYGQLTYAAERQKVCKGFPVAQHVSPCDSPEALRNRLEAAVCFVLKECQGDTQRLTTESLEISIHKGNAVDAMSPAYTFHVGKGETLISTVVRLLEYSGIDHYDALLPVRPTAENADFELTGVEERQGRLDKGSVTAGQDQATVPGWNSDSVPHVEELKEILQRFCERRGAHVQVHDADARTMQTAWNDRDATGTVLHTLLQAGLTYADAGMHHARCVADQWRGFYTACTQGEGRRLGADMPQMSRPLVEATATSEVAHKANQQKDTKAEAKNKQSPNHQSRGSKRKEQDSQATGLETVQAGTAPGGSKQAEPRPHDGPPIRRLRKKTAATEVEHTSVDNAEHRTVPEQLEETNESDTDVYPLYVWQPRHGNKDPRMERECAIRTAADLLSRTPTLPWNISAENARRQAYDLPSYHCAFCACSFVCQTSEELQSHLWNKHASALLAVSAHPRATHLSATQAAYETYLEILSCRCQQNAPLANCSLDRRCLRRFRENLSERRVGAAVCFVCARRFPFTEDCGHQQISWLQAYDPKRRRILGQEPNKLEALLGRQTYEDEYVNSLAANTRAAFRDELGTWTCQVACPEAAATLLVCPEDKVCEGSQRCPANRMCAHCRVPICIACYDSLYRRGQKPAEALTNDMLLGHPPRELYALQCTVLEVLSASPCLTALTCFSIEWRYLSDRSLAQDAFMNRHRLCAKGNATTFPLQWEDLLSELERLNPTASTAATCRLPHVGYELRDKIAVLIKVGNKQEGADVPQRIIHQAVVRRQVVVGLIAAMVSRGHPAYKAVDMAAVMQRAEQLPEDDVPAEIVALFANDGTLTQVQRQKAATPVNDAMTEEQLEREFSRLLKPNAVVLEKSSAGFHDINARHVSAMEDIVHHSDGTAETTLPEVVLYTGTKLLDQFQPTYFGLAFPFVFPYGLGMPDPPHWSKQARHRRAASEPRIELSTWVRTLARRVEAQVSRDWVFGFTSWNLLFRSSLNLSRTTDAYSRTYYDEDENAWVQPTGHHVETAAKQLLDALRGSYVDVNGHPRAVKGDVTKLQYVRGLKPMARKLLKNMRHTAHGLPGTQEARKRMRFEIQAMRIRYGVPLFVTFTPDEAHQLLFIRMSRVRRSDPVRSASVGQDFPAGAIDFPSLACKPATDSPLEREFVIPMAWADRREVLARDPLAAVDGFRTLTHFMLRHLFGVRSCPMCPDCNKFPRGNDEPCQDRCGSNAEPGGGIFGRVDAVYISLEAQKSTGGMHGHAQVFVQCLHQHTALEEIFEMCEARLHELRRAYEQYNAHVCHASYAGQTAEAMESRILSAEASWPDHEADVAMTAAPPYQLQRAGAQDVEAEAAEWRRVYMEEDVVSLQLAKQHHYHPYSEAAQSRVPLSGCQKSDRPGVCKSDFPRTQWLCSAATVLCPCKLKSFGMPFTGRKNRLGALHGPYGNEWLNGCAPAMLAGLRGANCDVQVPYRLPYACDTCGHQTTAKERRLIALAAQRAQDAQTGYCADYCSKSQPMGFAEIKEFQKGHEQLHAQLQSTRSLDDVGKRHATRFLSDAYLKSVVRGQVECCNLRAEHRDSTVVAAERIATAAFESLSGADFVHAVLRLTSSDADALPAQARSGATRWTRRQKSGVRHLATVNVADVYGHRPVGSEVWWLSPYEFTAAWRIALARVPTTRREWESEDPASWDVALTQAGVKLINDQTDVDKKLQLKPSLHYQLIVRPSSDRILLEASTATESLRHRCYLQRRMRPCCPHFETSPVPVHKVDAAETNARLTMTYFRAWTLNAPAASANVPFAGRLRLPEQTWVAAMRLWLMHLPCEETKRYVGNFLSVYRVRPTDAPAGNSDDSGVDESLVVTPATLPVALETSFRQTGKRATNPKRGAAAAMDDPLLASYQAAAQQAEAAWQASPAVGPPLAGRNPYDTQEAATTRKALKTLSKRRQTTPTLQTRAPTAGSWQAVARDTVQKVNQFLVDIASSRKCNSEQVSFLETVCARLKAEAVTGQDRGGMAETNTEALRWALHGGPGTGKSYVLNLLRRELFEDCLGWRQGVEFQVVAFQAVNAEPLDGETIHKALGLAWHGNDHSIDAQRILDLAKEAVKWRWLLIDEISMVSAEMLARLEARCRQIIMDLSATKYVANRAHRVAPFGGLNVIFSGDLWQLPPPRGTFLGQIPWQLVTGISSKKLPLSLQGQQLVWASNTQGGVQGVTELTRCERTQDVWLQELQAELRHGRLSEDNHAFLHGKPTKVCGSWSTTTAQATCGQATCQRLSQYGSAPTTIQARECATCRTERASKQLVAIDPNDPRFHDFELARALFHTNGVKCHANKQRAERWARTRKQRLYYAVATDRISSQALHEKPDIAQDKLTWLQRSDADSGNRYGVLPLCLGMPVQAREHLHRGDFKILRGCHGVVCGWSAPPTETVTPDGSVIWNTLPEFVFVRFQTRTRWTIPGVDAENVFPVSVQSKEWFLDAGRTTPKLKVTRYQFPLAPDFADTFHGAQGSTAEPGVIPDLCGVDPLAAYVGMTRSRTRQKILIYRPFPLAPFQQGLPLGRQLLLDVWKQEPVDWDALRKKYLDERPCHECGEMKRKDAFTKAQWKQETYRVCKECTAQKREAGTPYRCTQCGLWHAAAHFASKHQNPRWSMYRVCLSCDAVKTCVVCNKKQTKEYFGAGAWKTKDPQRRTCLQCQSKSRGTWRCASCHLRKSRQQFSTFVAKRPSGRDGTQTCDACHAALVQGKLRKRAASSGRARLEPLRKKLRHDQVLRETWEAIAQQRQRRTGQPATGARKDADEMTRPHFAQEKTVTKENLNQALQASAAAPQQRLYVYTCPFCHDLITTPIASGHIDHRRICGKQFRVHDGLLRPILPTQRYSHACPTCGTSVQSTIKSGRIQIKHKQPNGRTCRRTKWNTS